MNPYIGHSLQLCGVQEYRLTGGKGDGMRMLRVRNGKGLDFEISLDRCADISQLAVDGINMGYFAPCGYVSPKYYDNEGNGFLKSFTAGFFTTCGLTSVGSPCTDEGEALPLHGTIANTPCENFRYWMCDNQIHIAATVRDAALFFHQLILEREYVIPLDRNEILMTDRIKNIGAADCPLQILYHCNMGYPLLDENAVLSIPSTEVVPRNDHAKSGLATHLVVEKPQKGYEEMCYYHTLKGQTQVAIYNQSIHKGMKLTYDADMLRYFTQWKMMGEYDYVMGLEPGNCLPDGRDVMRQKGILEQLKPGEERAYQLKFEFTEE